MRRVLSIFAALLCAVSFVEALDSSAWKYRQELKPDRAGLIKVALPDQTLDAAKSGLEDLRILDRSGREVPYVVQSILPEAEEVRAAHATSVVLEKDATVISVETGIDRPIDSVRLETPAAGFIKAAQLEGSQDGRNWKLLLTGAPLFREAAGANLQLAFPGGAWAHLRITLDDARTPPIPVSGASLHLVPAELPQVPSAVSIKEKKEEPGVTGLVLDLGARHLTLAGLRIRSTDPLFTRNVTIKTRQITENVVHEQLLCSGVISRVAVEGQPPVERLEVPVNLQIPSRQILLFIENRQSPPIAVDGIEATRRPVFVVFLAAEGEAYTFLTGNFRSTAPAYDLSGISGRLNNAAVVAVSPGPLTDNPAYRAAGPLPDAAFAGTAIDVNGWKMRKQVAVSGPGVQQLELDLEVLSRARPDFADVRLVRDGKQIPYLVENTSWLRSIKPSVSMQPDAQHPHVSRWMLKLPQASLPVRTIACGATSTLFRRTVRLYENRSDSRGSAREWPLAQAEWVQASGDAGGRFLLDLQEPPQSDTLILETDNGDNPPLSLRDFELYYPVTRLLFPAPAAVTLELYYGNEQAAHPRYDIQLMAQQLLESDRRDAQAGAAETLGAPGLREHAQKNAGILFWLALVAAVVVLLFVVSRLLPKSS